MGSKRGISVALLLLTLCLRALPAEAAERSYPLDCLPDRVGEWQPVAADPNSLFGATVMPGIVLGPPGNSLPYQGSLSVASLGFGGSVSVVFDDIVIEDRPGPDFIVFENAFFRLPLPLSETDDFAIFAEPAIVEVSQDGLQWFAMPYDPQALAASAGSDVTRDSYSSLIGLAGITPTFTGNWTEPDDPATFDVAGTGGVSGAGGDAFDLADVGLAEARFVRITDANTQNGFPGPSEGVDLDAVVVVHGRPVSPQTTDTDGDGLSDLEETEIYGTDPALEDTDGDGEDDGREVAACHVPGSSSTLPVFGREPRLWLRQGPCTELRWSFAGSGETYSVVRGELQFLATLGGSVDLGPLSCLAGNSPTFTHCDFEPDPVAGAGFFYLVSVDGTSNLGRSSSLAPRAGSAGCP